MAGTTVLATAGQPVAAADARRPGRRVSAAGVLAVAVVAAVALCLVHLTQGTSAVGPWDIVRALTGSDPAVFDVLLGGRLPRLISGILVGVALGAAGAAMQATSRNPLASPDTLAVNAGAWFAVTLCSVFGLALGVLGFGGVAFAGGLVAAALVIGMGGGAPMRLVLAGSAVALAVMAGTTLLMILFQQETAGLYAWGSGTLGQASLEAASRVAPVILVAAATLMLLARRLDLLALGDDAASVLGLHVRRTRMTTMVVAVLLSAAAVTLAGPIGFVGLSAPVIVRLVGRRVPMLLRHAWLLPASMVTGVVVVVGSDVLLRAVFGPMAGVTVPTGVPTSILGATLLVALARTYRSGNGARAQWPVTVVATPRRVVATSVGVVVLLVAALVAGMLLGDTKVLLGDIANWLADRTGPALTFVLDTRLPRVLAALVGGAALAVAGVAVQAVCRNPLAEPGLVGATAGAGFAAVCLVTWFPLAGAGVMTVAATVGAVAAFAVVLGLSWRRGLDSDRVVLMGIGVAAAMTALTTLVIVLTDPWNTGKVLTWLSGSTWGRSLEHVWPVALALVVLGPAMWMLHRRIDLLVVDDDTPRLLGVPLDRTRLVLLGLSALLVATSVTAVGVTVFVGLVAPHVARALVGGRHALVLPIAAGLGALLVSVADTLGRTVIAPAQVPAGLVTAIIGAPYFVWLLWRSRRVTP
ncbi:MAG TPA: iron ABC transporter permease [Lapillicoccus sp.]|nr:iron ABC transporter permease [Lapillicoccus sp.]